MDRRVGAQLYTIKESTQTYEDFDKSMEKVSKMGYRQVQASGLGITDGTKIRQICDKYGLEITCTHRPFDNYVNNIEGEIEYHKQIGCSIAGLGAIPGCGKDLTEEKVMKFIAAMNTVYDKLAEAGITFAYHNHAFEFMKLNGKYIMDLMIEYGKFDFIIDTYWLAFAGIDSADYIKKLGKRVVCIHLKDIAMADPEKTMMADVGYGNLKWEKILSVCEEVGVTYALVEKDDGVGDPFECLERSYNYLKQNGSEWFDCE